MRPLFVLHLLFTCCLAVTISHAELPDVVVQQLRYDVRDAMTKNGQIPPVAAVDETLGMVMRELNSKNYPFELSPTDLVEFRKEETSLADAEVNRVMIEFKKAIQNKQLPHLLAYYDQQRERGVLTPRQKILCYRLILRLAAAAGLKIEPAAKP